MEHYATDIETDILILGAGCAGTSLAHHLEQLNFGGHVVLLDERTDWEREQRWCSWRIPPSLRHLIAHRWNAWQARDDAATARQSSDYFGYSQISAPAFFDYFHQRWAANSRFQLLDDTRVLSLDETPTGVEARTSRGTFRARLAFDARHAGGGALRALDAPGHLHLCQSFVGWNIETERACFDENTATLMDFRLQTGAPDGVDFAYVLPTSPTQALVESTHFGARALPKAAHEAALHDYIARHVSGGDYRIIARERGELPMASAPLRERIGRRTWAIGVAGGAARPSSGYAFGRIQKQTARMAQQIVDGTLGDAPSKAARTQLKARKYAMLDEIFLQVMARDARLARQCFMRMFTRVPPAALVRFLSEESSLADDARIIAALPKLAFSRASAQRIGAHWPARNGEARRDRLNQQSSDFAEV